jgi:uncharacterized protein YlxW (UPF0749 family)
MSFKRVAGGDIQLQRRSKRHRAALLTIGYIGIAVAVTLGYQSLELLNNIEATADRARSDASDVRESVNNVESDLSDLQGRVDMLESDLSDVDPTVRDLQLQVG